MALWLIHGMESKYQGLHGIEDYEIFAGEADEVELEAQDLSREVIATYGIEDEYEEDGDTYDDESELLYYIIYRLDESKCPKDMAEWEDELYYDPEKFIKNYSIETL